MNQGPSRTAFAVGKWVDSLELRVSDCRVWERREVVSADESHEIVQCGLYALVV